MARSIITINANDQVVTFDGNADGVFNAAHNPFFRRFASDIVVSEAAQALPEMGGAGWVRDLREAMSLGTAQADALVAQVQQFAAGTTKAGQMALLDELIRAWAASNEYVALKPVVDPLRRFVVNGNPEMSARLQAIVPVLEIFNGLGVAQAGMQNPTFSNLTLADGSTQQVTTYTLFAEQVQPMLNAYEQLRQSVYGALVMQTRLCKASPSSRGMHTPHGRRTRSRLRSRV